MQNLSRILTYLLDEKSCTDIIAEQLAAKLTKYDDIESEFIQWLDTKEFPAESTLSVGGYTAAQIHKLAPVLDGAGVYNFLVTMRDNPGEAERIMTEGFIAK